MLLLALPVWFAFWLAAAAVSDSYWGGLFWSTYFTSLPSIFRAPVVAFAATGFLLFAVMVLFPPARSRTRLTNNAGQEIGHGDQEELETLLRYDAEVSARQTARGRDKEIREALKSLVIQGPLLESGGAKETLSFEAAATRIMGAYRTAAVRRSSHVFRWREIGQVGLVGDMHYDNSAWALHYRDFYIARVADSMYLSYVIPRWEYSADPSNKPSDLRSLEQLRSKIASEKYEGES